MHHKNKLTLKQHGDRGSIHPKVQNLNMSGPVQFKPLLLCVAGCILGQKYLSQVPFLSYFALGAQQTE